MLTKIAALVALSILAVIIVPASSWVISDPARVRRRSSSYYVRRWATLVSAHSSRSVDDETSGDQKDSEDDYDDVDIDDDKVDVLAGDGYYDDDMLDRYFDNNTDDTEEDWIPDAEIAKRQKALGRRDYLIPAQEVIQPYDGDKGDDGVEYDDENEGKGDDSVGVNISDMFSSPLTSDHDEEDDATRTPSSSTKAKAMKPLPSPYTEEEEELIAAMGGKERLSSDGDSSKDNKENKSSKVNKAKPATAPRRREEGFLGDSTLEEIAIDYSVPICYLADVLCGQWGVPVPINTKDRLGDLVTGEQAFALVEAVNSMDVAYIQDMYSNMSFQQLCFEWDIDLKKAFEYAMKEGWTLPFGIQTNLRQEQEVELLRVFSALYVEDDDDEAYNRG
jgi:hypothetical protein